MHIRGERTPIVIVGASHAGASAVHTLRHEGYDGPVVLVGDEVHLPYERPPLSKGVLHDGQTIEQLHTYDAGWYAEHDVETRLGGRAVRIRSDRLAVELDGGAVLPAASVLIATGSLPRRLPFAEHERIRYLRTYEDAVEVGAHLRPGGRVIIVGAGFIGAEVAAAARARGAEVVMLELLDVPFSRALGEEVGRLIAAIHRDNGVDLRPGQGIADVEPSADGVVVTTSLDERLEADLVVIGVGVVPNDELARVSGIATDNGILTDAGCATSMSCVYAAGDVVNLDHPLYGRVRVEHYDSAIKQGAVAARNILGKAVVHADPPWFWSDQYHHNLQYGGHGARYDRVVLRGEPDAGALTAFFLADGRLVACFGLNRGADVRLALRMINRDVSDVVDELADTDTDLRALVRAGARS